MIRIPRNGTISLVPMTVTLYDDDQAPLAGEAANLSFAVREIGTGYRWDFSTLEFANAAPVTEWSATFEPEAGRAHSYVADVPVGSFPRGRFRVIAKHTDGDEWQIDIDHGIGTNLRLGQSASYTTGSPDRMKLTLWVEEDGARVREGVEFVNTKVLIAQDGNLLSNLGDAAIDTNGLGNYDVGLSLVSNTAYVLETTARLSGVGGAVIDAVLRTGLIRA